MSEFDTPEAEIAYLKERLAEARREKDEALDLLNEMRESLQQSSDVIDSWIEVFEMQQDERGVWIYDSQQSLWQEHDDLLKEHARLTRDWNKFVARYNATISPKDPGRPLAASDDQIKRVHALRAASTSLRVISQETGVGLRTVRTILDNAAGKGRTAERKAELRKREFNRLRAAAFRARKRKLNALPQQIHEMQKHRDELQKAARGLASSKR